MGICTTLIGVLPTYAQIGIFAPVLLVTLRIVQGLGAGAEISGAGTMLAEYAPKGKRGIISSLVAMGTNCGTLREGANKQVISSQADSLIKISRIWADFFPANTSNQPI